MRIHPWLHHDYGHHAEAVPDATAESAIPANAVVVVPDQPAVPYPCEPSPGRRAKVPYFEILFVATALVLPMVASQAVHLGTVAVVFVSIVLEALPFVLLGSAVGGFIEVFVPSDKLAKVLPARAWWTPFVAGLLGIVFPVCECAVVPVARRFIRKGVPLSAAVTYLLAGPIVNPIVAASTVVAYGFDWRVPLLRMAWGYAIAVIVGTLYEKVIGENAVQPAVLTRDGDEHACVCEHGHEAAGPGLASRIRLALMHATADFIDVGRYLVIGAFIAAFVQTYLNQGALARLVANPVLSILVMMLLAIGLNLCSEADAFVAASFRTIVPLPAQMAFLLLSPMLDLKLMLMYRSLFRVRAAVVLATLTFLSVFAAGLAMHFASGGSP